jgi:glycosyltransferase involved in cell wall biosynthesis
MSSAKTLLSIIIPVYNEEKTIGVVLDNLEKLKIEGVEKEIIVVDDGSKDNSKKIIREKQEKVKNLRFIEHKKNQGKGAAVATGVSTAKGNMLIIQDADLEYDPNDIPRLIDPIIKGEAKVVYGTRLRRLPHVKNEEKTGRFLLHYLGNRWLSLITSTLYGSWITDMETCYKAFSRESFKGITLRSKTFDVEPEITAKFLKKGIKIHEIDINTKPRGYEEGKKLHTFRDGFKALWTLVKYRFVN